MKVTEEEYLSKIKYGPLTSQLLLRRMSPFELADCQFLKLISYK